MKKNRQGKILLVLLSFFWISFGVSTKVFAAERTKIYDKSEFIKTEKRIFVPGDVIVKFKKNRIDLKANFSLSSQIRKLVFKWTNSYKTEDTLKNDNVLILKIKEGQKVDEVINALKSDKNVEYAEPNYYREPMSLGTDDTYSEKLWGLDNVGQTLILNSGVTSAGTSGADIDIARAWNLSTGTSEVIVAVIDSGVAYNHPDLIDSMWDGSNCKDENGNNLGGCLHGYDFQDSDNNPLPTGSDHGTHVAGIIAATRNNSMGVAGVGPKLKIMALKFGFDVVSEVKAIDFAIQNGVKVINASFGGPADSTTELEAINRFRDAGGIFVTAAGNEGSNNEVTQYFPSDYSLDNIISVAATDQNDELATFSNYGSTSVDVGAPGVNIYSTVDEAKIIDYDFDDLDSGLLPVTWTSDLGSSWGAMNVGVAVTDYVVYGDLTYPYTEGVSSFVTANTIDLSLATNAKFEFMAGCDTEITDAYGVGESSSDYMALEISSNGIDFNEISRWNEKSLSDNGVWSSSLDGFIDWLDVGVSAPYFSSNFKYRLVWVTDSDGNRGTNGGGCFVDNFKIITYTDGSDELYDFKDGTSVAAPYVSGLAGYLWSVDPSATTSKIITGILDNGDTLSSLEGKTVTGRRINAYNSYLSLGITAPLISPSVTGLSNDMVPKKSKTWTWSSDNPGVDQYRFLIDQSIDSVPSGVYGTETSTTYSTGTGTFYIHVQAIGVSNNEGPVSTASFILDNSGPIASVSNSNTNIFTLSFGETLYSNIGETFAVGSDFLSRFSSSSEIGISESTYDGSESITIGISGTPLAGSNVTLLSGTDTNNFYDYLTNAGGDLSIFFDGDNWWANPTNLNVASINILDLITTGQIFLSGGSAPETALSMTTAGNLTITIGSSGVNSSVGLTAGTIISEIDDNAFDANLISGTEVDLSSISNLETGYAARGAIQWGIPGITLKFSQPIQVRIYLGGAFDGQVMNIYRSSSLSANWVNTGLSTTSCTVSGGYCSFAAVEASYFVAAAYDEPSPTPDLSPTPTPEISPTPTLIPSNNNSSSNQSSNNEGPKCNDRIPLTAPDLFRITTAKGSAKIIFTPVKEKITGYAVMYGFKKGDERYAAMFSPIHSNEGEQSFTIYKLNPKVTYYFKVTAFNGCVSGPWSDWIPAKADRKREIHKYKTVIKNKVKTFVNQFK